MKAVLPTWHSSKRKSKERDRDLTTPYYSWVLGRWYEESHEGKLVTFPFYIPAVNPIHLLDSSLRSMYLLQAPISLIIEQEL